MPDNNKRDHEVNQTVSRVSNTTLYSQLEEIIQNQIESGIIKPGQAIPSERELSRIYSMSRMTVRRALDRLVMAGLLTRVSGKGTYVSEPKMNFQALTLEGLRQQVFQMGKDFDSKIINFEKILATDSVIDHLKIEQDTPLFKIERLFFAAEVPVSVHKSYIPCHFAPNLMDYDLTNESLYKILNNQFDLYLHHASETLETTLALPSESLIFDVQLGSPMILLRITMFDQFDNPVEYVKVLFRGDKVQLSLVV